MKHDEELDIEAKVGRRVVERREELLAELRPVVLRRGRRRQVWVVGRSAGLAALALAAVVGGVRALNGSGQQQPPEVVAVPQHVERELPLQVAEAPAATTAAPVVQIEMLETRVGISKAVEVTPLINVERASDDDLITALIDTGQEPELVRVSGRIVIAGNLGRQ